MEFKICLKKIFRTPLKSFLFFILLTISGVFLSLGVSLLMTAKDTVEKSRELFTTIAVPNIKKMWDNSHDYIKDVNIKEKDYDDEFAINRYKSIIGTNKLYYQTLSLCSESKVGNKDLRIPYLAFTKKLSPILFNGDKFYPEWDLFYHFSVLDVSCVNIRESRDNKYSDFIITWELNQALVLHPLYEMPETIDTEIKKEDMIKYGHIEIGKRYLITGRHFGLKRIDEKANLLPYKVKFTLLYNNYNYYYYDFFTDYILNTDNNKIVEGDINPYVELSGDTNVFLYSNEGIKFKQLIDNLQSINHSAYVLTTDNINSVFYFNQKKALIIQGREILLDEYEQGQKVCLVSSEYAKFNNLNIGDEIKLSFANAKYKICDYYQDTVEPVWFLKVNPFSILKSEEQSFKIVGIYKAPKWNFNEYFTLSPNTIFVPTKSVDMGELSYSVVGQSNDNLKSYEHTPPNLFSIIIPNDNLEEFKKEMDDKEIGKYLLYYDQGYSIVKNVLKTLYQNAIIILTICIVAWLLVLVLFVLLYIIKENRDAGIMLSLGLGIKKTFAQLILSCMLLALPSTVLGGIISNVLETKVTELSYEMAAKQSTFDNSFSDNVNKGYNFLDEQKKEGSENQNNIVFLNSSKLALIATMAQFMLIILVSSIFICFLLRKNPMELVNSKD